MKTTCKNIRSKITKILKDGDVPRIHAYPAFIEGQRKGYYLQLVVYSTRAETYLDSAAMIFDSKGQPRRIVREGSIPCFAARYGITGSNVVFGRRPR